MFMWAGDGASSSWSPENSTAESPTHKAHAAQPNNHHRQQAPSVSVSSPSSPTPSRRPPPTGTAAAPIRAPATRPERTDPIGRAGEAAALPDLAPTSPPRPDRRPVGRCRAASPDSVSRHRPHRPPEFRVSRLWNFSDRDGAGAVAFSFWFQRTRR